MPTTTCLNGRFTLWKRLSDGPGGLVYLAEDRLRPTRPLTLKTIPMESGEEGTRFYEGVARISSLSHPHLNPVLDHGQVKRIDPVGGPMPRADGWLHLGDLGDTVSASRAPATGSLFITAPYLGGGHLGRAVEDRLAADPDVAHLDTWLCGITVQVLEGLRYLHDRGLLHFDIKPEHIMLSADEEYAPGIPRALLIDLGLTAPESIPLGTRVRGTFPFIAPEVLDRSMVDQRVDLYSLGATLYHAVTGFTLLRPRTQDELQEAARLGNWPAPRDLAPTLPEFWDGCIRKLLARDPDERYASAAALLDEFHARSECPEPSRKPVTILRPPRLVGREKEFDYIARDLEKLKVGESGTSLILLSGVERVGKRAVSRRLVEMALLQGIEAIRVRCRGDADAPFDPLCRALEEIRGNPLMPRALHDELELLIQWLRTGETPESGSLLPLVDRRDDRLRMLGKISGIFTRLTPEEAHLILIENLHLAAPELVDALAIICHRMHLYRGALTPQEGEVWAGAEDPEHRRTIEEEALGLAARTPSPRVLFIATVDDDKLREPALDAAGRTFDIDSLSRNSYVSRIALRPLSAALSRELARETLGPCHLADSTYRELHDISNGHSEAMISLLRECQHYGLLRQESHGWVTDPDLDLREAVVRRRSEEWEALGRKSRTLLLLLDSVGGTLETRHLEEVLIELSVLKPLELLDRLESYGWVRRRFAPADHGETTLDRQLPAEARLTAEERSEILEARARALLKRRPGNPVAAASLLSRAGGGSDLEAILPRTLEILLRFHCDASLVLLQRRLGESSPPELRLETARALIEMKAYAEARELMETLLDGELELTSELRAEALLALGGVHRWEGHVAASQQCLDDALVLCRGHGIDATHIAVLQENAELHIDSGFPEKALEWAQRAVELTEAGERSDEVSDPALRAQVAALIARIYNVQNRPERALKTLRETLREQRDLIPAARLPLLLHQMAEVEFEQARYDEALELFEECLPLEARLQNYFRVARLLARLGIVHYNRGERDEAFAYHRRSLRISEEIANLEGVASAQNNIGMIYAMQHRLDQAEACFRRCLQISEERNNSREQATVLSNLSDVMVNKGEYTLALQYSLRGLEKRKALNNQFGIAFSYYRIANIYRTMGELERASDYAEKALEIRRDLGDKLGLAYSLRLMGDIHLYRGHYYEAFRLLTQSLSNFEALRDRVGRHVLLTLHGRMHHMMGLYTEALEFADRSLKMARDHHLDYYRGASLLTRGHILIDQGQLSEAEADLTDAEGIFRAEHARRELASVLLEKSRLNLEIGNRERGQSLLAEAYNTIEQLGILDLYPLYYRLRGSLALGGDVADLPMARKLLERGIEEAARIEMPEELWRLHFALGRVESRAHRRDAALHHLHQAVEILRRLHRAVPAQFQESYLRTAERTELLAEWETLSEDGDAATTDAAPAEADAPADDTAVEETKRSVDGGWEKELLHLHEMTLLLATERNLQSLLERIMDIVLDLFRAERGFLILIDGNEHEIRVARNIDNEEVEGPQLKYSRSIAGEVAATGSTFITNDAQHDERLKDAASVHDLRLQAIACFPLEWLGERLGVIYIENRFSKRIVEPERAPILEAFSSQAAVAIVNARLVEETERRREELEQSRAHIEQLNRQLQVRVERQSRELESARREIERKQTQLEERYHYENILGECEQMQDIYAVLEKISGTDLPVLVEGESGTGKELVANAIHYTSQRRQRPIISENCGALAESLLESELFGHVRGAFTGADSDQPGLFALAEGGTLFLDEVHELTLPMQRKLLRVIQEGEYRQVGGKKILQANVRILSASNQPLMELVQHGKFREDLFYRLNVLRIEMPPLRHRGHDLVLLARHFLNDVVERENLGERRFTPAALKRLASHDYPGNVRELRNIVEKAAILAAGSTIDESDIVFDSEAIRGTRGPAGSNGELGGIDLIPFREAKDEFQRLYIKRLLDRNGGVVSRAAQGAGITRESLHRLIKKLEIQRDGP